MLLPTAVQADAQEKPLSPRKNRRRNVPKGLGKEGARGGLSRPCVLQVPVGAPWHSPGSRGNNGK